MSEQSYELDMLKKPVWNFINAGAFAKENLLYIQESGRFYSGSGYYTRRTGLESYLITLTLSGAGILEYCGKKYKMTAGNVMFIDCRHFQYYYTEKTAGKWETAWVHLNGSNAKAYYERFIEKNGGSPIALLSSESLVGKIIEDIIAVSVNYSKNPENELIADHLLNGLLKECVMSIDGGEYDVPDYIKQIASFIRHHYNEEINLRLLAEEFNISKFHLQRTFKSVMGLSPTKYLSNVRIYRAKELLRGTNLSVSEIAEQIGMEPNYFIQLFKTNENVTPKQYRNNWFGK